MKTFTEILNAIKLQTSQRGSIKKAIFVSILNQIISSGTNFALSFYLVRILSPNDFGLYGIGFLISLFYVGIGSSLFLSQMVVNSPDKINEEQLPYAGRIMILVTTFCITSFMSVVVITITTYIFFDITLHNALFACAIMACSVSCLLKDFFVRNAYNQRCEIHALIINSAIACTMTALLIMQHRSFAALTVVVALLIYSVSHSIGAFVGLFLAKLPVCLKQKNALKLDLLEAWRGGKWEIVSSIVYSARTQAHTIVVTALMGPIGVAKLNAARLLVSPAVMLIPALAQVVMPRLVLVRKQGRGKLIKKGYYISFVLLSVSLIYSILILLLFDYIKNIVFSDKYDDLFYITFLWCLYACAMSFRSGLEMIAQALKYFRELSCVNIICAVITLAITYVLTMKFDLYGAIIGVILGKILLIFLMKTVISKGNNLNYI